MKSDEAQSANLSAPPSAVSAGNNNPNFSPADCAEYAENPQRSLRDEMLNGCAVCSFPQIATEKAQINSQILRFFKCKYRIILYEYLSAFFSAEIGGNLRERISAYQKLLLTNFPISCPVFSLKTYYINPI